MVKIVRSIYKYLRINYLQMLKYIKKLLYLFYKMETKNIHINLSAMRYSDRLEVFIPAKGYGCDMYLKN